MRMGKETLQRRRHPGGKLREEGDKGLLLQLELVFQR